MAAGPGPGGGGPLEKKTGGGALPSPPNPELRNKRVFLQGVSLLGRDLRRECGNSALLIVESAGRIRPVGQGGAPPL
jgi:hypothetical protein